MSPVSRCSSSSFRRHPAEQQNHARGGIRKADADDRLLRYLPPLAAARPGEERGAQERDAERDPESDPIMEVVSHDQCDTGAERRPLRQRQIDEDDLAFHHVQPQVHEQWRQDQAGRERPLHHRPGDLDVRSAPFPTPSPACGRWVHRSKYDAVFGSARLLRMPTPLPVWRAAFRPSAGSGRTGMMIRALADLIVLMTRQVRGRRRNGRFERFHHLRPKRAAK
jgi:hypothetical protein